MPAQPDTAAADCGVHMCYIADERSTSARLLGQFTHRGLAKGQRVVWLVDSRGQGPLAGLANGSTRGGDGAAMGQVQVADAESVYLDDGSFEPDRMLERYRAEVAASREAGYTGLRVVADTSWLADRPSEFTAFLSYESRVSELFDEGGFAAICHYDPARLPVDWLRAIDDAHPLRAEPGRGATVTAGICQVSSTDDGRAAVAGEIDCSNATTVRALLDESAAEPGDVHVDASGLRFVDVAGARALLDAAHDMGGDRRLIMHDGPRSLRVVLEVMGWTDTGALTLRGPREAEPAR